MDWILIGNIIIIILSYIIIFSFIFVLIYSIFKSNNIINIVDKISNMLYDTNKHIINVNISDIMLEIKDLDFILKKYYKNDNSKIGEIGYLLYDALLRLTYNSPNKMFLTWIIDYTNTIKHMLSVPKHLQDITFDNSIRELKIEFDFKMRMYNISNIRKLNNILFKSVGDIFIIKEEHNE